MIPGEVIIVNEYITVNANRESVTVQVTNTGDRPVQAGSHFHFFEVNRCLSFPRGKAYGMRLDIPSGTAVRFEPGEIKTVNLTAIGGHRKVFGFNGLTQGALDDESVRNKSFALAVERCFMEAGDS